MGFPAIYIKGEVHYSVTRPCPQTHECNPHSLFSLIMYFDECISLLALPLRFRNIFLLYVTCVLHVGKV